jgi:signal peptide peptidase SppA
MSEPNPIESIRPLVPHIEQFLGPWAIEEKAGNDLAAYVRSMDLVAHVQAARGESRTEPAGPGYQVLGGVAMIELRGTMTKYAQSLSGYPGSVAIQRRVRLAAADKDVSSILLVIDSPGGTVAGTGDLADAVAAAGAKKPIVAYGEDLMASAAYEVGSQAQRIVINNDAVVGSIGTYAVLYDWSSLFAREGIKPVVIRAGKFKGAGTQGTEITAEQVAEFQRTIEAINREFLGRVARGRKLSMARVQELATGGVEVGRDAVAAGLADEIGTLEAAMKLARKMGGGSAGGGMKSTAFSPAAGGGRAKEKTMSEEITTIAVQDAAGGPKPATTQDLKKEFPDSTAEWREACVENHLTLTQATREWVKCQNEALSKARQEAEQSKAEVEKARADLEAAKAKPGQPALRDGAKAAAASADDGGSATERWQAAVAAKMAAGLPRHRAVAALSKEQPALREAYEAEYNADHPRKAS